jgi:histone acetyltransferase (RNA polymerase elongator complex component)
MKPTFSIVTVVKNDLLGLIRTFDSLQNQNNFDPIKQTLDRIASLEMTGHIEPTPNNPCKLEFIVSGGTFNFYPKDYLMNFMTSLYYACNCYYEFQRFYKKIA